MIELTAREWESIQLKTMKVKDEGRGDSGKKVQTEKKERKKKEENEWNMEGWRAKMIK